MASHPSPFRVAAVQAAPCFLDLPGTLDKTLALIAEAARRGARLIAFPETWIPGYPWFSWLDSQAWCLQFIQRYHDNSLVLDSPEYRRIEQAAREHRIWVVMGYSEKAGGSLYMGQSLIDDSGRTRFTRRKLKPTHVERTVFGEGDGSDLVVTPTALGNIGALCCWEHFQPLTKYAMYAQNEQIHVSAWPSFSLYPGLVHMFGPEVNIAATQVYAAEGQCFVLSPSCLVSQEMLDLLCTDEAKRRLLLAGGGICRIFGPDGRSIGTPLREDEEGLMYAEIDLSLISLAKSAADPVGHYSRPDVTRLLLDRTRRERVIAAVPPQDVAVLPET